MFEYIPLFLIITGFVLGLGAVTVIDIHGFLGRKSFYWTEATTRTHKITKPLIWLGMLLFIVGFSFFYKDGFLLLQIIVAVIMVLNGLFLSFSVSPFLLRRENQGKSKELLPKSWQTKITISFIISFICWWGSVFLFVYILKNVL